MSSNQPHTLSLIEFPTSQMLAPLLSTWTPGYYIYLRNLSLNIFNGKISLSKERRCESRYMRLTKQHIIATMNVIFKLFINIHDQIHLICNFVVEKIVQY